MTDQKSSLEQKILDKSRASAAEIIKKEQERSKLLLQNVRAQGEASLAEALEHAKNRGQMIHKEYEASARLEAKLLLFKKKDEIISRVIQQAWEQLKVRVKRDDYAEVAGRLIQEGVQALGLKDALVILGTNEKQYLGSDLAGIAKSMSSKLGWSVKLALSGETLNSLGGVKVTDSKCHLLYDNTWDARLERIKQGIAVEIAQILFPSEGQGSGEVKSRGSERLSE